MPNLTIHWIRRGGPHQLKCFAKDRSGNRSNIESRDYTIEMTTSLPDISADIAPGELTEAVAVTLTAQYDATVYYTVDGSTPDTGGDFFTSTKSLEISQNGNHSIRCLCVSDAGQVYRTFDYTLDDHRYPQTGISPSLGGIYVGKVQIQLTPNEAVEWSKYTLNGAIPNDDTGLLYTGPFALDHTARLKWRSKDMQGNIEPVHTAAFTVMQELDEIVFDNDRQKDGYVKVVTGSEPCVGTLDNLVVGTTADGGTNRAILHFDTASIPDNIICTCVNRTVNTACC